jgi:uncharacterized membrane protein (DUF106 family)
MKKRRNRAREWVDRFILSFGFGLMLGLFLFGEDFRKSIAEFVSPLLDPIAESLPPHLMILLLGLITGLYSTIIQKYVMDWDLIKEAQWKMSEFQKMMKEAQTTENKFLLKRLEEIQPEIMELQSRTSRMQLRSMAYIVIVTIPLFIWAWFYIQNHPNQAILFPIAGELTLMHPVIGPIQLWIVWYFFASIGISQIIRKTLNVGGF